MEYRYIIDENANMRTPLNRTYLVKSNNIPDDCAVCFRIKYNRRIDETKGQNNTLLAANTDRIGDLGLVLRMKQSGKWNTIPIHPNDKSTLSFITERIKIDMSEKGYEIKNKKGFVRTK